MQIEKILPGDIVIATNLAGRGTDIHTQAIEEWGGMHVIVTFMPQNQRVQDQAFGRTARQGKLGTGQMILNMQQLGADYEHVDPKQVTCKRDMIESDQLDQFQNNELKLIQAKDNLFKQFSQFLNMKIRKDLRSKTSNISWSSIKKLFFHVPPTQYENCMLSAIEEQWAMFLCRLDNKTLNDKLLDDKMLDDKVTDDKMLDIQNAEKECDALLETMWRNYESNTVIKNLYYHIVIGNYFMVDENDAKKASYHFNMALIVNKVF